VILRYSIVDAENNVFEVSIPRLRSKDGCQKILQAVVDNQAGGIQLIWAIASADDGSNSVRLYKNSALEKEVDNHMPEAA
jgi:hypothetical protein